MKSDLLEQSPEPAIRHSPGTDFESEETRYAGREPQEMTIDPGETLDDVETEEKVRSFAGLYSAEENPDALGDEPAGDRVGRAQAEELREVERPLTDQEEDEEGPRVLDNAVPFHPEDPLRETN